MGSSKKFKKKKQLARDAAPPINPATGHSKKVKKKKQVPSDAARISALETALARAERAERAARRALKNDNRQHESLTDSEEGEWQPFPRSNLPQAPPPATRPANSRGGVDAGQGFPRPTLEEAMVEINRLSRILLNQQERIDKLEQRENRTADVLEAVSKLALETAQSVGNTQEVAEFSMAIGDT